MGIPKVIYQTHKLPMDKLPTTLRRCVVEWRDRNPDYEHRYFDDNALGDWMKVNACQMTQKLFHMLCQRSGASAIDLWRILVLFKEGGVYADADSKAVDLDRFVEHDAHAISFAAGGADSEFGSHFSPMHCLLIFEKEHPLLAETLSELLVYHVAKGQYWAHGQSMPVEFETGPGCLNRAWMRLYGYDSPKPPCTVGRGASEVQIIDAQLVRGLGWSNKALDHDVYMTELAAMDVKRYN